MTLRDDKRQLQELNLTLRIQLEEAEVALPLLNELVARISSLDIFADVAILGEIVLQRPYDVGSDCDDSYQLLQAALIIPGGVGVAVWDLEEFVQLRSEPTGLKPEVRHHFLPLFEMSAGEKALLLPHVAPLTTSLLAYFPDYSSKHA